MASRCFSPPERVTVLRCSKPARPTCASASGTAATISGRGRARFSRPNATSSSTRVMTSWLSGSWKTRPIRSPSKPGRSLGDLQLADAKAALPAAGQDVRHQAGEGAGQGALA